MMILDKKSYDLLSYLLKLETPETVMAISHALNQSRRKVYYQLDKINQALPKGVDQIISYPRLGILLTADQKAACRLLLEEVTDYNYVMKSDERRRLSSIYIAVSTERVTIDKLMQINDVSRNTILNDLTELREELEDKQYKIQLHATKARGYYFGCHPMALIQYLYKLLVDVYQGGNTSFIDIFNRKLSEIQGLSVYFSKDILTYFHEYLFLSQASLGKTINTQDSQFMLQILPFMLLSYRNMRLDSETKSALKQEFHLIWKRKEYHIAQDLARELYHNFKLHLDDIEVSMVAMLMLSFRKDQDHHVESQDYDDMRATISHFIDQLESRYQLHFTHKQDLLKQLTTHCKALVYRKAYGIFLVNPLTDHIKEKYEELFAMTQSCATILEQDWTISLTDDDIAYLTIHLGGELRHNNTEQEKTKLVIVSDDGIGIQKLLFKQCQRYLANGQIEAVFTTEQYQSVYDLLAVDMIVATTDTLKTKIPMLIVNPILSDDDIIKLIRFSKQGRLSEHSRFSTELTKAIEAVVKDESDRYALVSKIEKLIHRELL
ncbi:ascorbate 6-phosphate lactonase [Streptococcus pyogenes JRS4]|uniref:Transcription antiterminator n=3 Tax=Streptococcus pyogenes TaxID=1314 RepID=A0ABD7USR4_STRPY|nr:transcription antiterminator [Streptococcus pyogenes]ABF35215.1 Transcription antiterminator, BglG family [Streptococcus pyogenes MGAS2096]EPZ45861.1 PRD domain protein [Streptococcus pyogenes GA41345]EQL83057.1 PRD domain protein [Streptococcus pyogenes GA19681]ERL14807.1 PRD domain protein [Streptococcus pyogenes GA06023]ESA45536.1 PRD domain protein [Streptococcus pyogenes GA41039]ESA48695.1 PRD domain protein [Streptococcus pyogenes GA41208]ESA49678.1 PRD domain protein [Streptococcus